MQSHKSGSQKFDTSKRKAYLNQVIRIQTAWRIHQNREKFRALVSRYKRRQEKYLYDRVEIKFRGFKQIDGVYYFVTVMKEKEGELKLVLKETETKEKFMGIFDIDQNFFINTRGKTLIDFIAQNLTLKNGSVAVEIDKVDQRGKPHIFLTFSRQKANNRA